MWRTWFRSIQPVLAMQATTLTTLWQGQKVYSFGPYWWKNEEVVYQQLEINYGLMKFVFSKFAVSLIDF
jgi:hypothetical protein